MDHERETWAYCCICGQTTAHNKLENRETQCANCGAFHGARKSLNGEREGSKHGDDRRHQSAGA